MKRAALALLCAALLGMADDGECNGCGHRTQCGAIQARIESAASGATVQLPNCVFRESVTINKPLTLRGPAEIRGSNVLTEWTVSGSTWVSHAMQAAQTSARPGTECGDTDTDDTCLLLEQLFINGVEQVQLANGSTPSAGEFAMNASRNYVIAEDPSGKVIESSVRNRWITVTSDDVTIDTMTFRYASNDAKTGALTIGTEALVGAVDNVIVKNSTLGYSAGAVLSMTYYNSNVRIENNDIGYGTQMGIRGCGTDGYVGYNRIHHNNWRQFWLREGDTGGHRFGFTAQSTGCMVEYNEIDHNSGAGSWSDGAAGSTWRYNTIHDNAGPGIVVEVSTDNDVYNNYIWESGVVYPFPIWSACIQLSTSNYTRVYGNVVAWCPGGINSDNENRAIDLAATNDILGVEIYNNTIAVDTRSWSAPTYEKKPLNISADYISTISDASNTTHDNDIWIEWTEPRTASYGCDQADESTLASYIATTCEDGTSAYITESAKDVALTAAGIPTSACTLDAEHWCEGEGP